MFSRRLASPWRRAFCGQIPPGGRVDLEEKLRIDNIQILLEKEYFLKLLDLSCG
jgi:hypothetical protein